MKKKYMYKPPNFFQRNFSFSGRIEAKAFWGELGLRLIYFLCAAIILCIAVVVAVPADTEELIAIMDILVFVLALIWIVPIIALTRRRLRDGGFGAKSYLWLLLPVIGWIVFLARLFAKSAE